MKVFSPRYLWVPCVVLLGCLATCNYVTFGHRGEEQHQAAVEEFGSIKPIHGAVVLQRGDMYSPWWPFRASASATYSAKASDIEIQTYYRQQMLAKGWEIIDEAPERTLGGDTVSHMAFRKGALRAALSYAPRADWGWTYSFSISWRMLE